MQEVNFLFYIMYIIIQKTLIEIINKLFIRKY